MGKINVDEEVPYNLNFKQCLRCRNICFKSDFFKCKARPDGLYSYCKSCVKDFPSYNSNFKKKRDEYIDCVCGEKIKAISYKSHIKSFKKHYLWLGNLPVEFS